MPRKIIIVGGGSAGWMTAAALAKNLAKEHFTITLVESSDVGTVSVGEATIPQIRQFNQMLGIDENAFLSYCHGSFKLGIEFRDWHQLGARYAHPFGPYGVNFGGVPFHHYYLRSLELNNPHSIASYNLEYSALQAEVFARPEANSPAMLKGMNYAFHFDAIKYADFLKRYATQRGVNALDGVITNVQQHPNEHIKALELADGRMVEGDFFIDCSGFKGLLIAQTLGVEYEDWREYLPCDSAVAQPSASLDTIKPYTIATAREAGWQWQIPLQHRIGNGHVYSSAFMDEHIATELLAQRLPSAALDSPRSLRWVNGRRTRAWSHNVVAIGLSAGFIEPLESTGLQLIQSGIYRLLSLFPHTEIQPSAISQYNRHTQSEIESIRDFVVLHYKATQREDTEFWRYVKHMSVPDGVTQKIELYRETGNIFRDGLELFDVLSWFSVMHGQGIQAKRYHPLAEQATPQQLAQQLHQIHDAVEATVAQLPSHQQYIAEHCPADIAQASANRETHA